MVPQSVRRPLTALALAAAGGALAGCTSIPGITVTGNTPVVAPPEAPASAPETSEPTATPSPRRTTYSPRPTTTPTKPAPTKSTSAPRPTDEPQDDEVRNGYVTKIAVQNRIVQVVREKTGRTSLATCPRDLDAEVGTKMTCRLTSVQSKKADIPVEVTVTRIEGRKVAFDLLIKG